MPKLKMTDKAIRALPIPAEGRVDYQDTVLPGLVLRVASTGAKTYSVSWWQGSQRPRVTLGLTEDSPKRGAAVKVERLSLADARQKAKDTLRDARVGLDPAAERRERKEAITFAELARDYYKRHAQAKKTAKGAREDELRIEKVLIPRWGGWKAGDIRKRDVVALLDEYEDAGKLVARNRMAALVSKIYAVGIKRDAAGVEFNPAAGLIDTDYENTDKRPLTDDELRVVLPLFRAEGVAGLGFRLLVLTGQRAGEVFGMRWSEVDGDTWNLPKERCKNRRSRHAPDVHKVPLSRQAREVLNELRAYALARRSSDPAASVFVFPSRRHGRAFTEYAKHYRAVRDAANLAPTWKVKHLRDTCLTGIKDLKFAPHVQSAIANHIVDSVTARHYVLGTYDAEKRAALDAWGDHVAKLDATVAEVVDIATARAAT